MNKQVNVLVSTYNGERYIRQQLDSVLNQNYEPVRIFVRDDGSTDRTVSIVREYEQSGAVTLRTGENIGYGKSFLSLLAEAEPGGYYAFCDQDDIWLPEKLSRAVKWLETREDVPALFHTSFRLIDEAEEPIGTVTPPSYEFDFVRSITECLHMGFASVFNETLRRLVLKGRIENLITHDWWVELIVQKYGETYFEPEIGAEHRRLSASVSEGNFKNKLKWLKRALSGNAEIKSCTKEFYRVFGGETKKGSDPEMKVVGWFAKDGYSLMDALHKACYKKRWRPSLSSELIVRALMLAGKI